MGDDDLNLNESDEKFVKDHSWLMRPCFIYDEEYSDCRSIRSRFHQRFVNGTFEDCSQWKHDYENCLKWKKDSNLKAFKDIVESETNRRQLRLQAHNANNIWKRRVEPPADWNAPLPQWMQEKIENSYLEAKVEEQKKGKLKSDAICVIS